MKLKCWYFALILHMAINDSLVSKWQFLGFPNLSQVRKVGLEDNTTGVWRSWWTGWGGADERMDNEGSSFQERAWTSLSEELHGGWGVRRPRPQPYTVFFFFFFLWHKRHVEIRPASWAHKYFGQMGCTEAQAHWCGPHTFSASADENRSTALTRPVNWHRLSYFQSVFHPQESFSVSKENL